MSDLNYYHNIAIHLFYIHINITVQSIHLHIQQHPFYLFYLYFYLFSIGYSPNLTPPFSPIYIYPLLTLCNTY